MRQVPGSARARLVEGIVFGVVGALLVAGVLTVNRAPPSIPWPPPSVPDARKTVAEDSLRPEALRNLGLALEKGGNSEEARPLLAFASERSRRDTPTQLWRLQSAFTSGRSQDAVLAADALLRRDISSADRTTLYAVLTAAARDPGARTALARRLALTPWWRQSFLRAVAANGDPDTVRALLLNLIQAGGAVSDEDVAPLLARRLAGKDYLGALSDWRVLASRRHNDLNLNDLKAPPPFGWSQTEGVGGSSAVTAQGLRIDYDGVGSPALPRRLVLLPQGRYRVTFLHRSVGDVARVTASVRCADGPVLAGTPPLAATRWTRATIEILVPSTACAAQWIETTPMPGDRAASAQTWVSNWRIDPEAG